jgi:hypothetical protein
MAPLAAVAVVTVMARPALGDDARPQVVEPEIFGDGGVTWDGILREVEGDPGTLGHTYTVGVRSRGVRYGCRDYQLSFDEVARAAFVPVGCDEATGLTRIRVASRAALFDQTGFVPRPRRASVYAALVQHARADGGGGGPAGGSRVGCSLRLTPYLWDGLRGVPVPLPWDRFELRPLAEDVHAEPDGDGWIARGESRMSVRFRYEVVDRATRERVIDSEATLVCEDKPAVADEPPPAPPPSGRDDALVSAMIAAAATPAEATPVEAPRVDTPSHSLASLKLHVVELAALRNDTPRFRGALQLGPYNGADDFAGGFQLGMVNTAGLSPWQLPKVPATRGKGAAVASGEEPQPRAEVDAFRGIGQVGLVNAVGGDFEGALQVGAAATFVDGAFRGIAQVGVLGAGMGAHSTAALQFGGFVAYASALDGLQISPCMAWAQAVRGIQFGGCGAMATRSLEGLQIGGGNLIAESTRRGESPSPAKLTGAQVGTWNFASAADGLQLGAVNVGLRVRGVQVGAVNFARHLEGIQLGAINIALNSPVPFMPVVNLAFGG